MRQCIWLCLLAAIISGCATQGVSTRTYTDPQPTKIYNEVTIPQPSSEVWDILVKHLSKSFYVINNIDKASRIINVSFSSSSPEQYIDCGRTYRTYTVGDKTDVYDYQTAASSYYQMATPMQPHPAFSYYLKVRRETSLEGRSNIYVAPSEKDPNITIITVNTRYIWTSKVKALDIQEHSTGNIVRSTPMPEETISVMFNTNEPGQHRDIRTGETISCVSKGRLEREILNMVGK